MKRVTYTEIANEVGISKSIVSNYFSDTRPISEKARARIREAIQKLGYGDVSPYEAITDNQLDLAWLAGIVDGEGSIAIKRNVARASNKVETYRAGIVVTMNHWPTIQKIYDITGKRGSMSGVKTSNPRHNHGYCWSCGSQSAISVIMAIRPFLVTKADEADVIFEFAQLCNDRTGRGGVPEDLLQKRQMLYEKIRNLKPCNRIDQKQDIVDVSVFRR